MPVKMYRLEESIAVMQIDRPAVRNALDWPALEAISKFVHQASSEAGLKALIVTGTETAFCAGGDIRTHAGSLSIEDGVDMSRLMSEALARLEALPFPTVAAIEGPARGGGAELALACDLRVMATNADIGFAQISLGLSPGWGGARRLLRLVGYSRAMQWLSLGNVLDAEAAGLHGLANKVVPAGEALSVALDMCREITQRSEQAIRSVKRVLRANLEMPGFGEAFEHNEFPPLWASEAHRRGVEKFLSRR